MNVPAIRLECSNESTRGKVDIGGGTIRERQRHATGGRAIWKRGGASRPVQQHTNETIMPKISVDITVPATGRVQSDGDCVDAVNRRAGIDDLEQAAEITIRDRSRGAERKRFGDDVGRWSGSSHDQQGE